MSASIALQKDVSISYLGPPGTFSHQAAQERFGDSVTYIAQKTIHGIRKIFLNSYPKQPNRMSQIFSARLRKGHPHTASFLSIIQYLEQLSKPSTVSSAQQLKYVPKHIYQYINVYCPTVN